MNLTASPDSFYTIPQTFLRAHNILKLFLSGQEGGRLAAVNLQEAAAGDPSGCPHEVLNSGRGWEDADEWTDLRTDQEGDPTGTEVERGVRRRRQGEERINLSGQAGKLGASQLSVPCAGVTTAASWQGHLDPRSSTEILP